MKKKTTFLLFLIISCFALVSNAQVGYNCDSAAVITSLPYVQTGLSTGTTGNYYADTVTCGGTYMTGNDYVFEFTPAYDMNVSIVLSNTGQAVGLFVADKYFEDTTAVCVASNTSTLGNPSIPNIALTGGVTYYFMVSTDSLLGLNLTTSFDISVTELIQIDAAVTSITIPSSGCNIGLQSISAVVENLGVDSLYDFTISCLINDSMIIGESIYDTILPGNSLTYTFVNQVNFSANLGTYIVKCYPGALTLDGDHTNDTASATLISKPVIASFPYTEDYESGDGFWSAGGTSSSWELGTPADSVINHAASGVNAWKTNLIADHNGNENSYVESPCFDFSTLIKPIIEISVWYETTMFGTATLQSSIDGGSTWQTVGANGDPNNWYNGNFLTGWTGNAGNYLVAKHILDGLGGQPNVKLRLAFNGGINGTSEGFAFDDVNIYDTPADDIGVISVVAPSSGCGLGNETVIVNIANFGTAQQSNFPVTFTVDGWATSTTETVSATLLPDDTLTYQFTATADLSAVDTYTISATTGLTGDADNTNDTSSITVDNYPVVSTFPYAEDFDGAESYWIPGGSNSSWALGTPAKTVINYAASSPNSWVTNLTGNHNTNEDSYVEGPCMDFANIDNPYIKLDVWYNTSFMGYAYVEASTDFGSTWTIIGANNDPTNWYNGNLLGDTGWSGSAGDWSTCVHKLDGLGNAPNVKLRVHFTGGMLMASEGLAFDNVSIFECVPPTAGFTYNVNGGVVTFTSTSSAATDYSWDFGDGATSSSQNPSHTYTTGGTYPVTLIVTNSCEADTITQNVSVSVGIDEFFGSNVLHLYPNPSNGRCDLAYSEMNADDVYIYVSDMKGQKVYEKFIGSISGSGVIKLDLSSLAKGVYSLKFEGSSITSATRIIIE